MMLKMKSVNRSNPSRNKPAPVNARVSRPSSSSETPKATSVSASRPQKKSPPPSVPPSSSPSSASSPCAVATGVPIWVSRTACRRKKAGNVVASQSEYVSSLLLDIIPIRLVGDWRTKLQESFLMRPISSLFLHREGQASSLRRPSNACSNSPVSKTPILHLLDRPRPSRIPSRRPSLPSAIHTAS